MQTIVISGPPGVGKSTVGAALAATLDVPFFDTDERLREQSGKAPGALLRERGEPAFRAMEREVVDTLLRDGKPKVVAVGGGALVDRELRHRAVDAALVISLSARIETLRERLKGGEDRPLLGGAGAYGDELPRLLEARRSAYAECHLALATDDATPSELADSIVPWVERSLVAIPLGDRSYTVEVVRGDSTRIADRLATMGPSSLVVVADARVRRAQLAYATEMFRPLTVPRIDVTLAPGEAHKTVSSVSTIWDAALGGGIDRDAVVVGFGGGVVLDLAGFAAATLLRGVRWLSVPSTTLALIDASVGGKTGFDHPAGKNLVGAFHQPSGVVADLALLRTLPPRERKAGLAEAVKIGLSSDASLFLRMEETAEALAAGDEDALLPVLHAAISAKARVVRNDETERGERALLNLGHTVGHALEAQGAFTRWLHGEAVAIGLVAELRAAAKLGKTDPALAGRVAALLGRVGLPTAASHADLAAALPWIDADKKRRGAQVRWPVVSAVGAASVEPVALSALKAALLSD